MVATATHRVTMPKKMSTFLARRAKSENTTVSKVILSLIVESADTEDDDPISEKEARYLVARAERNEEESKGKRLYTHEEVLASLR